MKLTRKHWVIMLITPLGLILDQVSKLIIHASLRPFSEIEIVPGYFNLVFVTNRGLSFGMFSNGLGGAATWIFLGITIVALGIIIHLFLRTDHNAILLPAALSLVLAGALGNLIDRFRWGYVVDFLQAHHEILGRDRYWPTFNVADMLITAGIILLVMDSFRPQPNNEPPEEKPEKKKDEAVKR